MLPGKSFLQIQKLVKFKGESVISLCQHLNVPLERKRQATQKEVGLLPEPTAGASIGEKENTPMPFSTELPEHPTKLCERKGTFSHFRLLLQLGKQSLVLENQN